MTFKVDDINVQLCLPDGTTKTIKGFSKTEFSYYPNITKLQEALVSGTETLETLQSKYSIITKAHGEYPNLIQFKYNQIESPMSDPIVQECRGIILDKDNNWQCVAYPFDKFFNYGEANADNIDWATARVQEKLDGSLIIMYWYDNAWQVATSGTPDAYGDVNGYPFSFAELFHKVWINDMGWQWPDLNCHTMNCEYTFMWELTTLYNKVVVQQEHSKITLIGIRDNTTGKELGISKYRCPNPKNFPNPVSEYSLNSIEEIVNTFDTMDPCKQEGYVIVDKDFNRVKVKHPGYVALHHLKDGMNVKNMLEIIRKSECIEFLTYFPEYKDLHAKVQEKYENKIQELQQAYELIKDISVQKDFALEAVKASYPPGLFVLRNGKSLREFFANTPIKSLMRILDVDSIVWK